MTASARRHSQRPVEPDHLAVEHRVLDYVASQRRILARVPQTARMGHRLRQHFPCRRGRPSNMGVSNSPGAIVTIESGWRPDRAQLAVSVRPLPF